VRLAADDAAALGLRGTLLTLRRAWPRSPGHLAIEFTGDGGTIVPAQWMLEEAALNRAFEETRERARRPERVQIVPCGEFHLLLQGGGEDRILGGLAAWLEKPGAQLIVHRPERRAVIRFVESSSGVSFIKFLPPRKIEALLAKEEVVRSGSSGASFLMPDVLEADARAGFVRYAAARGLSLHEQLPSIEAARLDAVGVALRELNEFPIGADGLPQHDASDEIAVVTKWMDHLRSFEPARAATLEAEASRAIEALRSDDGPRASSVIHRDFYEKQVFVEGGQITFLDFDTAALGEREIDVANMIAHLERREPPNAPALVRAFREGYGPVDESRLRAYRASAGLRLECVHAFRPPFGAAAYDVA
jgi:hypothetical protein